MTVFRKSSMEVYFAEGSPLEQWPCEVRLEVGFVAVSYDGDAGPVVYEGRESGEGHFKVTSAAPKGTATLHRFSDSEVLEGWWSEDNQTGMWRIFLDE